MTKPSRRTRFGTTAVMSAFAVFMIVASLSASWKRDVMSFCDGNTRRGFIPGAHAFVQNNNRIIVTKRRSQSTNAPISSSNNQTPLSSSPQQLRMGFLDDLRSFFDSTNNNDNNDKKRKNDNSSSSSNDSSKNSSNSSFLSKKSSGNDAKSHNNDDDDDLPAGRTRIATIPVERIKPGGLRLFIMLYLMGMQNTPDKQTWQAHQPTTTSSLYKYKSSTSKNNDQDQQEYLIDYYFYDHSALLSIGIDDSIINKEIRIDRVGSRPSNAYLMQESVIVQGILDELQSCANDDKIALKDRLLVLPSNKPNAIQDVKESLAFG